MEIKRKTHFNVNDRIRLKLGFSKSLPNKNPRCKQRGIKGKARNRRKRRGIKPKLRNKFSGLNGDSLIEGKKKTILYRPENPDPELKKDVNEICNTYGRRGVHFLKELFNKYN